MLRYSAVLLATLAVFRSGFAAEVAPPPVPLDVTLPLEGTETPTAVCVAADNRRVFAALEAEGKPTRVYVWNLATRKRDEFAVFTDGGEINRLTWSADGMLVAWQYERISWMNPNREPHTIAVRREVRLERGGLRYEAWSEVGNDLIGFAHRNARWKFQGPFVPHRDAVFALAHPPFPDDPALALVPFTNATAPVRTFAYSDSRVSVAPIDPGTLALSADGKTAAICSCAACPDTHRAVWLWDVAAGGRPREIVYQTADDNIGNPYPLALSRGGEFAVTGSGSGPARVFDARTKKELHTCWTPRQGRMSSLACSPTADVFAIGRGGVVEVWGLRSGKKLAGWPRRDRHPYHPVVFSPDGSRVAWGSPKERVIRVAPVPVGE